MGYKVGDKVRVSNWYDPDDVGRIYAIDAAQEKPYLVKYGDGEFIAVTEDKLSAVEPADPPAEDGVEAAHERWEYARAALNETGSREEEWYLRRAETDAAAAYLIALEVAHAADQQRIAELEAALVDCFRFSLQLTVQSRIAAAQPGSAIQTRIYAAFGEDKLVTLLAADTPGSDKQARGAFNWQPGDPPAEEIIRRAWDGEGAEGDGE